MPERQQLGTVSVITDDDTGMYTIGEIDGGFSTGLLQEHIQSHGADGVIRQLSHMIHQVYQARDKVLFATTDNNSMASQAAQPGDTPCTD